MSTAGPIYNNNTSIESWLNCIRIEASLEMLTMVVASPSNFGQLSPDFLYYYRAQNYTAIYYRWATMVRKPILGRLALWFGRRYEMGIQRLALCQDVGILNKANNNTTLLQTDRSFAFNEVKRLANANHNSGNMSRKDSLTARL